MLRGSFTALAAAVAGGACVQPAPVPPPPDPSAPATVLLVRHAEKSPGPNPDLTPGGLERAEALAEIAAEAGVEQIYTTGLCRTAQTAQPAARRLGVGLRVVPISRRGADLEGCDPPVEVEYELLPEEEVETTARRLLADARGSAALVVGHSNSVPEWIAALGGGSPCPAAFPVDERGACWIPDADFHHLFVVTVSAAGAAELRHSDYGRAPAD